MLSCLFIYIYCFPPFNAYLVMDQLHPALACDRISDSNQLKPEGDFIGSFIWKAQGCPALGTAWHHSSNEVICPSFCKWGYRGSAFLHVNLILGFT